MDLVNIDQIEQAIGVLSQAFRDNPGVLAFIKQDQKRDARIWHLCSFCIKVSILKQGAFISSNEKGVALMFENSIKISRWNTIKLYAQLGQYSVGWTRAIPMLRRESAILNKRTTDPALYFWMLAVEDQSNGLDTIKEVRDFVFSQSKNRKLDIIAETISKRTLTMYLRYGFHIYDELLDNNGLLIYFIRRPWNS